MYINSSFELDKILKIFSYSNSKIIFLYDISTRDSTIMYTALNSLIIPEEKAPKWSSISTMAINEIFFDINHVILANLEHESNQTFYKRKILIPKIKKTLHNLEISSNKVISNNSRTKFIVPLTATLSTFGVALGVPLFSTLMFRQDQIINGSNGQGALGLSFFYAMLTLAISFIVIAIGSTIISLLFTVKQQRKEIANHIIISNYKNMINKYFYLETDNISNYKKAHRILISQQFILFFNNVSTKSNIYNDFLQCATILRKLNCHVCLCFNETLNQENKSTTKMFLAENEMEYVDYKKYKTNFNTKRILNVIYSQISLISGLSSRQLINNYKTFTNIIYRFLDTSSTNTQLLELLYIIKKFLGANPKVVIPKEYIPYLIDLITLGVFKILEPNVFEQTCNYLINYFTLSNDLIENYYFKTLNIESMLHKNLMYYNKQSLFFMLSSFLNNEVDLKTLISSKKEDYSDINVKIVINTESLSIKEAFDKFNSYGFAKIQHNVEDVDYVFERYDIFIYYKVIDSNNVSLDVFDDISAFLELSLNKQINYLMINLFGVNKLLQLFNNRYEIISDYAF